MTILRALGIAIFTPRIILLTVTTLTLLGVVSNCLFELWKPLPTLFLPSPKNPDWPNLCLYGAPALFFFFLVWWAYRLHARYVRSLAPSFRSLEVPPMLALSWR